MNAKGEIIWSYDTEFSIRGRPISFYDQIAILDENCELFILGLDGKLRKHLEFEPEKGTFPSVCLATPNVFDGKLWLLRTQSFISVDSKFNHQIVNIGPAQANMDPSDRVYPVLEANSNDLFLARDYRLHRFSRNGEYIGSIDKSFKRTSDLLAVKGQYYVADRYGTTYKIENSANEKAGYQPIRVSTNDLSSCRGTPQPLIFNDKILITHGAAGLRGINIQEPNFPTLWNTRLDSGQLAKEGVWTKDKQYTVGGANYRICWTSRPVLADNKLVVTNDFGSIFLVNPLTGEKRGYTDDRGVEHDWFADWGIPIKSDGIYFKDHVYFIDYIGNLLVLDLP